MKHGFMLFAAALIEALFLLACSGPLKKAEKSLMENYLDRAESHFEEGLIDSSLYYLDLCYSIDSDYPGANHLAGKIYLYKDGVYNRRLSAEALKKALKTEQDNSEFHFSLGQTFEKQGYFNNALREYKAVVELDSSDYRALERIAEINKRIGIRYDDKKYFERSLKASTAAASITRDPRNYYRQGLAFYQMAEFDSSVNSLEDGLALCLDDSEAVDILLLLGTDLVRLAKFDSAHVVFERVRKAIPKSAFDKMTEFRYLMTPEEYKDFESRSIYEQDRLKRQYWGRLDPNPTTEVNERLLEHLARYIHTQLTFSVPDRPIDGWRTKRGEMYIRYGKPSSMEYLLGSGGDASDSPKWVWRYDHFPEPVTLIFEDTFLNGDFDFPYPKKEWTAADYDKDPARLAAMLQSSIPQTFGYNPGSGPLEYYYMPRQFKGGRGKTTVEVFVAIPYKQLQFRREGEYAFAEIEWRQILKYGSWKTADSSQVRRTYRVRASQVDNERLSAADRLSLTAYPDSLLFSISIRDTLSDHQGIGTREVGLRDFYTGQVEISDLVLARRIDSLPERTETVRSDLNIISNLDNRYFVGEPIWLYFEIYNLRKDDRNRTSYVLKQTVREKQEGGLLAGIKGALSGDKLQETSISYKGSGVKADENRILTIDASRLEPGEYTVSIDITDEISGLSASVSEDIVLYR